MVTKIGNTPETDHMRQDVIKLAEQVVSEVIRTERAPFSRAAEEILVRETVDQVLGFGPIEPLIQDESITEIMVNGPTRVYVERKGNVELSGVRFQDENQLRQVIEKIVSPLGRRIDESSPMVDARLPDGSRVNAVIPPLAIDGSVLTIRKFSKKSLSVRDLVGFNSLSRDMATFLAACVRAKANIMVSGGTGSGKTTLLGALSSFIPSNERILTIEDAAELRLQQDHIVRLESRPPNIEGQGQVSIRDLVKNALRMRPDRIIVGEVRGGETLDMLQAMNTGHEGSLSTLHANTPRDCLSRMETMTMMAGMDIPQRAIREQIASAIDIIVQIARLADGSRRIISIAEVIGMEEGVITLQEIFRMRPLALEKDLGNESPHEATGLVPQFLKKIEEAGISLPPDIFKTTERHFPIPRVGRE
ncbi:MAG: CpaF family protein [Verrucomicrobiota bacterium]|nr:CpaF family protein [Verrucomicrobiota bacterium]MDD8045346.1 CpaF family protein [Verrucomicrobiota bacterium]MDD8050630.1 CpaF family protein [Verrucomicrobiota bacterium]MDI9382999.1 CpaF family protein [Verrucomicrobiota bacterium]